MTKHFILIAVLCVALFNVEAQSEYEALKFTQNNPGGSARFVAMGGAFSALGADLSVMGTNPAGTGMYRKGEMGMTTAWSNYNMESSYNGTKRNSNDYSFRMSNIGFVTVNDISNNDWKKVNFGFSYNQLNDFNRSCVIEGTNHTSSMLDLQTDFVNADESYYDYSPYVGAGTVFYDQDLDLYVNDFNNSYWGTNYGANQQHRIKTSGYAGEYNMNVGANYKDYLFIGATLGFQRIKYRSFVEHDEQALSNVIDLQDFESDDILRAKGSGFDLKLGVLYKLNQVIRLGAAFHTPTFYDIKYDYSTDVTGRFIINDTMQIYSEETPSSSYDWSFSTPTKFIFSSAAVIGKLAIVSAEIEYLNYSRISMSADDNIFEEENKKIEQIYNSAINARIGAEVRLSIFSLRGGFAYYNSPYSSSEPNADANKVVISGGVGINIGSVYFDAAYQHMLGNEFYYMYGYDDSRAELTTNSGKFLTTIGLRF